MNTYQAISNSINSLKESNMEAGNELAAQFNMLSNSRNTVTQLKEIVKQDDDIADRYFSDGSAEHAEARDIQEAMISFFGGLRSDLS